MAEQELKEAKEKQEVLQAAKEMHNSTEQTCTDCQRGWEQLARMQEENMIGLESLNLPSLDATLAASMNPIIQGVVHKYSDIFGNEALVGSDTPSEASVME